MPRLHDRSRKSSQFGGSPSVAAAGFDSSGVREDADLSAAEVARILLEHPSAVEIGLPGIQYTEGTAGNASVTYTVPTGKYWRLLGLHHLLVTDANVANRDVVVTTRTSADATIEALTHVSVAASSTAKRNTAFGSDDFLVGNEGVAAQGTLTVDTIAAEDEEIVLNGVTFTWKDALTAGNSNELLVGANVAASKAALEAAFVDRDNGGTLHSVTDAVYASVEMTAIAFATNDMVFTANVKGLAGSSLATTTTMAGGANAWGAATLGDTTEGVDQADKVSALDYPDAGIILEPAEDINVSVTLGVAGDSLDTALFYIEYSADPTP